MPHNQGWRPEPEQTELYAQSIPRKYKTQLNDLPFDLERSAFPFRALAKVLAGTSYISDGRLDALNQGNYGSCVGFAAARTADITAACDIIWRREAEKWPTDPAGQKILTAPDWCYGASRDVSGSLGRWQGSYGGAAAKALREYGAIFQQQYGKHDLSTYSISSCRSWAARGVPADLVEEARAHQFLTTVRVESVDQAVALVQNGYGFSMCCGMAWSPRRDEDGFARRTRPGWSHAQAAGLGYINIKRGKRTKRGFLIQNSWGNKWQADSPFGLVDQPHGSYFIRYEDMATALLSKDCYAVGDYEGFREKYNFGEIGW